MIANPPDTRAFSEAEKRISKRKLAIIRQQYPEAQDLQPPRTRADCIDAVRPCPWVSCRYHMWADVSVQGSIKFSFPSIEPQDLPYSCALDVADVARAAGHGITLAQVGALMNITRERVRQLEKKAITKAAEALKRLAPDITVDWFGEDPTP